MAILEVVILAAGVGSRLRPLTDSKPKALIDVAGQTLLGRLMDQLLMNSDQQPTIHVIAGHFVHQIQSFLSERYSEAVVIYNDRYRDTNNMFSLSLAFPKLDPSAGLLIVNGDCMYDNAITDLATQDTLGNTIFVDSSVYLDEAMKVTVRDERVEAMSKQLPQRPGINFTSIDLYRFDPYAKLQLSQWIVNHLLTSETDWTEVAIDRVAHSGSVNLEILDIAGLAWAEIDTPEDLTAASKLFGG